MRRAVGVVLVLGALITGCSDAGPAASVSSASGEAATLDAEQFAAAITLPDTTILDVRTPAEYAQGHLPGALNIDVNSPDFATAIADLDKTKPYAVYCRSGNRSATALHIMADQGFTAAYHLGGGIGAWSQAGGEIVQ
jgi:rhodanese-related sulfurtransferase